MTHGIMNCNSKVKKNWYYDILNQVKSHDHEMTNWTLIARWVETGLPLCVKVTDVHESVGNI